MTARFSLCCKPYDTDHTNRSLTATPVKSSDPFILPIENTRNPPFTLVFQYRKLGPKVPKSHLEGVFRRVPKMRCPQTWVSITHFSLAEFCQWGFGATPKWAT